MKFILSFILSFLILAFPVGGKPVFYYLFNIAAPMTEGIYDGLKKGAKASLEKGQEAGWGLFTNAVPPSKNSSKRQVAKPQDNIQESDNEKLEALIKD